MIESQPRFDIIPGGRPYTTSEMLSKLHERDLVECSPPLNPENAIQNNSVFILKNVNINNNNNNINNNNNNRKTKNKKQNNNSNVFLLQQQEDETEDDAKLTPLNYEDDNVGNYDSDSNMSSPPDTSSASLKKMPEQLRQYITYEVWESYSPAKRDSFANLLGRPNSFFYRNRPPGDPQIFGTFSPDEEEAFIKRIDYFRNELKIHDCLWGLFAVPIKGRVGYQCMNFYRHLIDSGKISKFTNGDPQQNDGKRRRSRCQVSPDVQGKLEQEAFDFIKECLVKDSPITKPQIRFDRRINYKEAAESGKKVIQNVQQQNFKQQNVQLNAQLNEQLSEQLNEQLSEQLNEQLSEHLNEQLSEQLNEQMKTQKSQEEEEQKEQHQLQQPIETLQTENDPIPFSDINISFVNDYVLDKASEDHIIADYDVSEGLLFDTETDEKFVFDDCPSDILLGLTSSLCTDDIPIRSSLFGSDVAHNSNYCNSVFEAIQTDVQKGPVLIENTKQKRRGRPPKKKQLEVNANQINANQTDNQIQQQYIEKQKHQQRSKYKKSTTEKKKKTNKKNSNRNAITYIHFAPDPITGEPMERPFLDPFAGVVMDESSWRLYFTRGTCVPYDVCAASFDDLLMVTRTVFDEYRNQIVNVVI